MYLISLIVLVVFVLVVLILMGGVFSMTKSFNLRSVYLYLVCFVTLIIFIIGTIFTVQKLVDVFVDGGYYYQTLEDYESRYYKFDNEGKRLDATIPNEEIKNRYEDYLALEAKRARANNIRQLASNVSAMVIGGAFWVYHWKKIKED